ncbi:tRNA (adenosine(37)-N6)-threonylcarbamoyltransferase complex ATPase subunit type 1 TsaE [bacterium]|nr:tRNA (adenosine(37)-N6)-threonylcarbamoyltransferase complex ATPase subunit type 1 TsaE [bacterium]
MPRIRTAENMKEFGSRVGAAISAPVTILLIGPMGAGKTIFAQGLMAGLGANDHVTSPSFLIAKEYMGTRIPAVHLDLFRIDSFEKFKELGLEEYLDGTWVAVCEWADRVEEIAGSNCITLNFTVEPDDSRAVSAITSEAVVQLALIEVVSGKHYA